MDEKGGGSGSEIKEPVIEFFPSKDTLELLQRYEIKIQKKSNAGRFFVSAVLVGANGEVSWEESYKDNVWEKYAELNKAGDFAAVTAYTTTPVGTDYWIFYITTEKPDFSFLEFITSEEDKPKGSCNNMESELFNGKLSGCKSKGLKEWMVIAIPITVTDRIANGGKSPLFNSK